MNLSRHHVVALIGATLTSAIALSDAILHGLTGRNSIFSDGSGHPFWIVAGGLVHGLTYGALTWVLIRERPRFHQANRVARALRYVLAGSLVALATGFIAVAPIVVMAKVPPSSPLGTAWVWLASIAFAGMILSSLLLGIAVPRTNPFGYGGRILGLLIVVVPITVVLGFASERGVLEARGARPPRSTTWNQPGRVRATPHWPQMTRDVNQPTAGQLPANSSRCLSLPS